MIHYASTQAESRFQRCIGEIHMTALNNSPQNIEVQSVELVFVQTSIADVLKTNRTELDWCLQL